MSEWVEPQVLWTNLASGVASFALGTSATLAQEGDWTRVSCTIAGHGARLDLANRLTQVVDGVQTIVDGGTVTATWLVWNDGSTPLQIEADWADTAPGTETLSPGQTKRIYRSGSLLHYDGATFADLTLTSPSTHLLFKDVMILPGVYSGDYFDGSTPNQGESEDDIKYGWTAVVGDSPSISYVGGVYAAEWVPGYQPVPFQKGVAVKAPAPLFKDTFGVEITYGAAWVDLNDYLNFRVAVDSFGSKAQTLRRITTTSPYFDGTFLVHSTRENVTEGITVWVYGVSQNHVTENLLQLEELFSQPAYRIRVRMDDHMETWTCQPCDYTIERTHVYMHNTMAAFKAQVPRMPRALYESVF